MAPSNISPGSAATVLSFLALAGLQLETRFRVGEVLAAPRPELSDEPEPELPLLGQLEDRLGRLEGKVAGHEASLAKLGARTARCEALLGRMRTAGVAPDRRLLNTLLDGYARRLQWDAAFGTLSVTRGILIGLEVSRLCWPRLHSRLCREVHVRHHVSGEIRAELRQSALLLVPGAAEVAER